MGITPQLTKEPWQETYSEIIDVRSQAEFAEDHIPGAINLPVLDNSERAEVGTIYVQESPFKARKLGAALVSRNIAQHLEAHFVEKPKDYRPLVYCWRGGQRSNSMAAVLAQIGWYVTVLAGGYKTYRTHVRQQLELLPSQFNYRILCGLTGTAKTHILAGLAADAQVIDLEGLANHRGSLLGAVDNGAQPSQKYFETCLLAAIQAMDPEQPVWLEAESNKIGQIHLPPVLWEQMQQSPCYEVQAPLASRVKWLMGLYPYWGDNPDFLKERLRVLIPRYGKAQVESWLGMIDGKEWAALVEALLVEHYDPAYVRSMNRQYTDIAAVYELADLSDISIEKLQGQLLALA